MRLRCSSSVGSRRWCQTSQPGAIRQGGRVEGRDIGDDHPKGPERDLVHGAEDRVQGESDRQVEDALDHRGGDARQRPGQAPVPAQVMGQLGPGEVTGQQPVDPMPVAGGPE
jgi:hypothetical protein